jgi:chemotaxis protein histidine kinase CheA
MNTRMGLKEFFAMEASEYLDRLDVIVSAAAGPNRVELVRLARALRGSALMANEHQISEVAAALENFAHALGENRTPWDERAKQTAIHAVDDLRVLVRKVSDWSDTEDAMAAAAAEELNAVAGISRISAPTRNETGIDSGTRAFVARECAIVASALHAVAKSLQQKHHQPEQFDELLKVIQPLRGLAVLPEISPIPEVLEGVERAVGIVQRGNHRDGMALLFDTAARALTNASQEIVAAGSARPDSPEAREFAGRFGSMLDSSEVVPIQSLFYDDDGPHVLEPGTVAAGPGRLAQLELVAHGEHLKQAADELERAQWDTQRELRALALTSTFRSLLTAAGGPLENAVAQFAAAAQKAVSRGAPLHHTEEFVAHLRETGATLTSFGEGQPTELVQRLSQVTAALEAIPTGAPVSTEPERDHPDRPAVPAVRDAETPDLAGGWARYERLQQQAGPGEGSLEEFLSIAPSAAEPVAAEPGEMPVPEVEPQAVAVPLAGAGPPSYGAVPTGAPGYDDARLAASQVQVSGEVDRREREAVPDEAVVPITDLCYRGEAALLRALRIREQIHAALARPTLKDSHLQDLVDELLDIVELNLEQ